MKFYKNLYAADSCREKKRKICWKLKHNAGQLSIYIIALSSENNLLEIYHCAFLQQKYYNKKTLFIVGIAGGYEEAIEVTQKIIMDVYNKTGGFKMKEYFTNNEV